MLAAGTAAQTSFAAVLIGLPVLAPALRDAYDLSLFQIGIVLDSIWIGPIVTLLPWGLLADRLGERLVLAVGLGGCGAALVGAAHAGSFTQLILLLALAGAAGASVNSASGRAVMHWFPASQRGLALGVRQTAIPLGGLISALSLPALGLRSAFVLLAALCFAGAIFGTAVIREREAAEDVLEPRGLRVTLRDTRLWWLCGGSSLYLVAQVAVTGFVVLFLHDERGFSAGEAAGVLAGIQVLATLLRIVTGRWSDVIGSRLSPLRLLGVASGLTLAVAASVLDAPVGLLVVAFILAGGLAMSWNGLSFTAAAELAGRGRSGAAIGMQQTSLSVAGAAVPPAFAALVAATSWRVGFALAAVFPLVGVQLLRPLRTERA
ncbi:MAG TPA: MFS transporter [Gaiellaceae bacterium]|nr:MFS transporter [Gaiellaceae bacterium]